MKKQITPERMELEFGGESAPAQRFVERTVTALRDGLRLLPAAVLLATVVTAAPGAGATGCVPRSSNVIANAGNSSNKTTLNISADGGTALADADGGDDNVAIALLGIAGAGNGGEANASTNGGTVIVGDVNSGNNRGNSLRVNSSGRSASGCGSSGNSIVNGGNSSNQTDLDISADGGTAVADADGGDNNVAVATVGITGAGNGGEADASADGGTVIVGEVNSGGNSGNDIDVD